jgi:hypothetical protein
MPTLIDSNILVFLADPNSPFFSESARAVYLLLGGGEELYVAPQNLIEFWVVATRPVGSRGLGMSAAQAQAEIARIKSMFRLAPDSPAVYLEWDGTIHPYISSLRCGFVLCDEGVRHGHNLPLRRARQPGNNQSCQRPAISFFT